MTAELLSSLAGAFIGAYAAFRLESHRRTRDEERGRHDAILATQFALGSQFNWLHNITIVAEGGAKPAEENPFRQARVINELPAGQRIDFSQLTFIASSNAPDVLLQLDLAQETVAEVFNWIEYRNRLLQEILDHPRTVIQECDRATGATKMRAYVPLLAQFERVSDITQAKLLGAIAENEAAQKALFKFARSLFPKDRLFVFRLKPGEKLELKESP